MSLENKDENNLNGTDNANLQVNDSVDKNSTENDSVKGVSFLDSKTIHTVKEAIVVLVFGVIGFVFIGFLALLILPSADVPPTTKQVIHCGDVSGHLVKLYTFRNNDDAEDYIRNNQDFGDSFACIKNAFLACDMAEINLNRGQKLQISQTDEGCKLEYVEESFDYGLQCLFPFGSAELLVADIQKEIPEKFSFFAILPLALEIMEISNRFNTSSGIMNAVSESQQTGQYIDFVKEIFPDTSLPAGTVLCEFYEISNGTAVSKPVPEKSPGDRVEIEPAPRADDSQAEEQYVKAIEAGVNQFAFDIYAEFLADEEGKNIFFSPYSIATALSMTSEGAEGETAQEILEVFGLPEEDIARRSAFASLHNRLNPEDPEYELRTANALWVQDGFSVLDSFVDTIANFYVGFAQNVDFIGATEQSRQTINTWVAEQTNDLIDELFPEDSLSPDTRLVLTNTIYFKGDWLSKFDVQDTRDEDFRVDSDTAIEVPLMRQFGVDFGYFEDDEVQVLEMPYKGDTISMLVVLPKDEDIARLERELSLEDYQTWRGGIREREIGAVYMPKFELDTDYDLNDYLSRLGMPSAFLAGSADFAGITGDRNLFIQSVVHDAVIKVDEEGTEAATATGVAVGIESVGPPPVVFRADHPFLFFIQERESGTILFMGRVMDPTL